mgnify:CR=1 FL=1
MKKKINTTADYVVLDTNDINQYLSDEQKQQLIAICACIGQKQKEDGKDPTLGIFVQQNSDLFDFVYSYMVGKRVLLQQNEKSKKRNEVTQIDISKEEPIVKPHYVSPFKKT